MIVQRPDNRIALPIGQSGGPNRPLQEHRLAQLQITDPERFQAPASLCQLRQEIGNRLTQVEPKIPCGLVGVEQPAVLIEDDHRFTEGVEDRLREGRKYRW
jgi:hypothetical protein